MENLKILIEFRNYTMMKYFHRISSEELESKALELFPFSMAFINSNLNESECFARLVKYYNINLELLGVFSDFENFAKSDDTELRLKMIDRFNEVFFFVDKKIVENESVLI